MHLRRAWRDGFPPPGHVPVDSRYPATDNVTPNFKSEDIVIHHTASPARGLLATIVGLSLVVFTAAPLNGLERDDSSSDRIVHQHSWEHDLVRETVSVLASGGVTRSLIQVEPGTVDLEKLGLIGPDEFRPMSISGCSITSGSGYQLYSGCLVAGTSTLVGSLGKISMWFGANYTLIQGNYNDHIGSRYTQGSSCVWPASCATLPVETTYVQYEAPGGSAVSQWSMPYTVSSFGSGTAYLELRVGGNQATSTIVVR